MLVSSIHIFCDLIKQSTKYLLCFPGLSSYQTEGTSLLVTTISSSCTSSFCNKSFIIKCSYPYILSILPEGNV